LIADREFHIAIYKASGNPLLADFTTDLYAYMMGYRRMAVSRPAAPRTSMARNTALLQDLTRENGGAVFWALIEDQQLICLNAVVADPQADPGFRPGEARVLDDTRISRALRGREPVFVPEPDGGRSTLMVPLRTPRGHDLGWVGFSLSGREAPPPAEAIKFRIDTLAATL